MPTHVLIYNFAVGALVRSTVETVGTAQINYTCCSLIILAFGALVHSTVETVGTAQINCCKS